MCHTPKNAMGGDENSQAMQGSVLQNWYAPNLTGSRRLGIGDWTVDDIALYLKTGRNSYDTASGPMADAVMHSTSHLTDADLRAIAVYLKDLPPGGSGPAQPVSQQDPAMQQGQAIYNNRCAACHTVAGIGIVALFPRLRSAARATIASDQPHPCGAGRLARSRHRRGSDRPGDAVLRLAAVRCRCGSGGHIHPQCLG